MSAHKHERWRGFGAFAGTLAFALLGLSGCDEGGGPVLSLHPIYNQEDLEMDSALNGSWTTEDHEVTFSFEAGEHKTYKLIVKETEDGQEGSAEFQGHLVRLGGTYFLDFLPETSPGGTAFYQQHLLRAHSIARIELSRENVTLAFLEGSWLKDRLDDKTVDVSVQRPDGAFLLTGDTREVQDFLNLYGADDAAFPNPIALTRLEESEE